MLSENMEELQEIFSLAVAQLPHKGAKIHHRIRLETSRTPELECIDPGIDDFSGTEDLFLSEISPEKKPSLPSDQEESLNV